MILVIAALLSVQDQPEILAFSRETAITNGTIEVAIGKRVSQSGEPLYWLARRVRSGSAIKSIVIDSKACPAIHDVLLTPLPVASRTQSEESIRDGSIYRLKAARDPSHWQHGLVTESVDGSPLATWVEGALEKLRPCWPAALP